LASARNPRSANLGVVSVGEVPNTKPPLPVSSVTEVASCAEVMDPVAVPYSVPEVGNVTAVVAVDVSVVANAPEVVRLPPRVMVLDPLLMPVPPKVGEMIVPCHTPVPIVPTLVSEDRVTPELSVDPVSVPAAAVTVMSAVPLNDTPLMRRAVCNAVAVPAFPVIVVWSPVLVPETDVVPVTASVGVEDPENVIPLSDVAVATPMFGVVRVGEVPNTSAPDPVSSEMTPANWAEVVEANADRLFAVRATVPVEAGKVMVLVPATAGTANVTVPEVRPAIENAPAVVPAVPRVRRAEGAMLAIPTLPPDAIVSRFVPWVFTTVEPV